MIQDHLAPNGLLFYTGTQFPEKYKNGASSHSTDRGTALPNHKKVSMLCSSHLLTASLPVIGKSSPTDFMARVQRLLRAKQSVVLAGLAQGPDGAIYVTDDTKGAIFKISYGNGAAAPAGAGE
ncbi:MAG: hypothetical protein WDO15_28440 [Bacteroidota bacterium]